MTHNFIKRMGPLHAALIVALAALPMLMAPGRCGESAMGFFSDDPAPSMEGTWSVVYDDEIAIEVDLGGGEVHYGTVSQSGGVMTFQVNGETIDLDLDCSLPWVVCPSEVWTDTVEFLQPRFAQRPHQVQMLVQEQECLDPRMPDENAGECSSDPADNMPCDEEICDPENMQVTTKSTVASISNPEPPNPRLGDHPDYTIGISLGGGFAIPAANCIILATSYADADIVYNGDYDPEPEAPTMFATDLVDGVVTIDISGACFWGGYVGTTVGGVLLGARVKLMTGFTASIQ